MVGSGPIGALVARRFAERGRSTLLLEAGHAVALPDVPTARPGEHVRNQARFRAEPETFLAEVMRRVDFYDAGALPEGLPGACETIAFGGQGILWTNNCPRTQAGVDRWDALGEEEWERRYAEAEAILHVTTDAAGRSERGRRIEARLTEDLAQRSPGRPVRPLPLAALPSERGGVHFTATADVLAGIAATATRRLEVRTGARVVAIEQSSGRATGVFVDDGQGDRGRSRLTADAVVVAAGAFASPRLLHASGIRLPALGRWLHYHPLLLAQIVLDEALSAPAGASESDPPPRLWLPPTRQAPWHGMVLRDVGAGAPEEPVEERRLVELQFFAPVEPRPEHRMTLDGERPRFAVELTARDREVLEAMRADVVAIGRALGRWRRGCEPTWNPWGFSHPMGTTRMGDDPATSVVDPSGRVHGTENLFVAGVGVIPVAIAVNPTLTAAALALVAADAAARLG